MILQKGNTTVSASEPDNGVVSLTVNTWGRTYHKADFDVSGFADKSLDEILTAFIDGLQFALQTAPTRLMEFAVQKKKQYKYKTTDTGRIAYIVCSFIVETDYLGGGVTYPDFPESIWP